MDKAKVEELFQKFPKLADFICAGTISLKAARTILDVDRWLMYDIFTKLLQYGAVFATGPTSWRATNEMKEYQNDRKNSK